MPAPPETVTVYVVVVIKGESTLVRTPVTGEVEVKVNVIGNRFSATPFGLFKVKELVVDAVHKKVPLLTEFWNPDTAKVYPA